MNLTSTRAACAWPDRRSLLLAAGALLSTTTWAGRPLATDDATILEPDACQVEAWHQHGGGLLVHVNAGWMRPHDAAGRATWSIGSEYASAQRWSASLESYGSHHRAPARQAGFRYALVERRLDIDASVAKMSGAPHQLALGMTWALPRLLY